ncbi:MAG: helix-turn-helix domain-containing protein [Clostridia bacterium]|nr:helix-turn-helix domain-containing protein [Clostridia bacterium]
MGKRSTKENKNIWQESREALELSREAASELLQFVSADRIEKIESGRSAPHPDEVLLMEQGYGNAELSNYYCTHECPIGMKYVQKAELKELPQLTVELLSALHAMEEEQNRLIDISVDGRVNDFERKQFDVILEKLAALDRSIRGMRIWIEHALYTGKMEEAKK